VQDPVTWTLPHLIQLQHEYKTLLENYNCDIQEFITVQDPPAPLSNILHLSPLTSLHSATKSNMELPQPGEPCKVQPLSQRTLSRQLMRSWTLWNTNIDNVSNARISTWMLEQLVLHTPKTFHTTSEQDLNPRPCSDNDHPSVLVHEMMSIEPGASVGDLVLSKSRCPHTILA
jgi:hypothetical protein